MTRHETIIKWARFFSHDLVSCSARAYILFLQTQFQNEAFAQGARAGKDSNPTDIKRIFLAFMVSHCSVIPFIRANAIIRYL